MQKSGNFYVIKFSKMALKDKVKLKNSGLDKTAKNILLLMSSDPFCYPPSYEKLYGNLRGPYSRRINRQHRIVYEVDEVNKEIHIIECGLIMMMYNNFFVMFTLSQSLRVLF